MKHLSPTPVAAIAIALAIGSTAPAAVAAQDAAAIIEYRQSIMQSFRAHMGGVRTALGGTAPMGHAVHHAVAFSEMAQSLANVFPEGSTGDDSRALPAIWADRDGFMNRVSAIQGATANLVEASRSGDADRIGAALQEVQGTCGACHDTFRGPAN